MASFSAPLDDAYAGAAVTCTLTRGATQLGSAAATQTLTASGLRVATAVVDLAAAGAGEVVATFRGLGQLAAIVDARIDAAGVLVEPLDAAGAQSAASAAITAKLPAGATFLAGAGVAAQTLDQVTGGGGVGQPVRVLVVNRAQVWRADPSRSGRSAKDIVEVGVGFAGWLAIEPALNPGAAVAGLSWVTIGGVTTGLTELGPSADFSQAVFKTAARTAAGTFAVAAVITTTDGQTLPFSATLRVA